MNPSPKCEVRGATPWVVLPALLLALPVAQGDDFAALCADRAAIERVYYQHRLGDKPPFEQTLPREALERLVRDDLRKEAALKKAYGVAITPAILDVEVQRINTTTRAPDILAELKAALDHDTNRFARSVAKPIVVERLLRERFDNDDALHAPQRREAEKVQERLLQLVAADVSRRTTTSSESERRLTSAATNDLVAQLVGVLRDSHSNAVTETTWQLGVRPVETNVPATDEIEIKKRFGPNAQVLSSPHGADKDRKFYFGDLPGELQNVLRVQLRQPGAVSAVIEMPGGFLVYVCKSKSAETLGVAALSLPKRRYEEWLQTQEKP